MLGSRRDLDFSLLRKDISPRPFWSRKLPLYLNIPDECFWNRDIPLSGEKRGQCLGGLKTPSIIRII